MSRRPLTTGIDHVGLTVRDLDVTLDFFVNCLGWEKVAERPEYPAAFVSDGFSTITLWEIKNRTSQVEFDRKSHVGLHHLALRLASEETLQEVFQKASAWPGVRIEFAPEMLGNGPKRHTMMYEPGGIRLEFDFDPRVANMQATND